MTDSENSKAIGEYYGGYNTQASSGIVTDFVTML